MIWQLEVHIVYIEISSKFSGLRILALATREIYSSAAENSETGDEVESDMTFLGLVGLLDPPR